MFKEPVEWIEIDRDISGNGCLVSVGLALGLIGLLFVRCFSSGYAFFKKKFQKKF
ncbi:hypothetical protein IPJ70_03670 [Candidatus Campbellbacteria bacterium]|nr:MAG: hypothetical protein IPJ70_03670 [Candidatus Campbellbacteria bacterium]